jgi:hypothetical protein
MPIHPKGGRARVLLSSVFKPFAVNDDYGSRAINPAELYHNQVTREQGPFSLRMFHRSWGLSFLQHNIRAACTVLDFPTRRRFVAELRDGRYDVVGISGIIVNAGKVREMCRLVREHSPRSTIVVGGHVTALPELPSMIDADYIVRGEGIGWLRRFLGEADDRPLVHPVLPSSFGFRVMGVPGGGGRSATIVPSVGCPMGCNFCTTSAFFGGKGRMVNFFRTGQQLFEVMCEAETALKVSSFFMMDENFLLYRRRALELLACMRKHGKAWSLYVFSSANAIRQYDIRELVDLGVEWIWLGLESRASQYGKLAGVDTLALTRELQAHGICVLGSTIVGLEHHTPANLPDELDEAVAHDAVFHQFMLYTPMPGTPLYAETAAAGRLLDGVSLADIHGQHRFNFRHPHIGVEDSKLWLDRAFRLDYERNGPSLFRLIRTTWRRWERYGADADARVRARLARDAAKLRGGYAAALWAMEHYLNEPNPAVSAQVRDVRTRMERAAGGWARAASRSLGPLVLWTSRREARRHPLGRRMEPRTFIDRRPAHA